MRLTEEQIFQYQRIVLAIEDALDGVSMDVAVPAIGAYLAAAGAFSEVEKKKFISWIVEQIDNAYEEFGRRKI